MTWIPYALFAVLCAVAMPLLQRRYKTDALAMLFWLRVVTVMILAPVVMMMDPPTAPLFYIGIILYGILVTYTDYLIFNFARTHNPAIAARLLKPTVIISFIVWFAFDPDLLGRYIDHPVRGVTILVLLILAVTLAMRLKHCSVTKDAFFALWPVFCTVSIYPIFSKYILGGQGPWAGATILTFLTALVVLVTITIFQAVRQPIPRDILFNRHTAWVGALIAVPSILAGVSMVMAFQLAPHPAYVSVVMMSVPVILTLYGQAIGDPDAGNKRVGFGLLVIAALIVVLQIR